MHTLFVVDLYLTVTSLVMANSLDCLLFTSHGDVRNCIGKRVVRAANKTHKSISGHVVHSTGTIYPANGSLTPTRPYTSFAPATKSRALRTGQNVTVPHRPTETLSRNLGSVTDAGHNVRVPFTKNADMPRSTNPPATTSRALRTRPNVTAPHRPTETLFRNLGSVTDAGHNVRVPFTKIADMPRSTNPPATTSRALRTGPNVTVPHRPTETLSRNLGSVTDAGHNVRVPFTKNADMPRSTNPPATTSRAHRTEPNVTVPHRPTETLSRNLGSVTDAGHNVRVPFTKNADMPRSTNPPATKSRALRTGPNVTAPHRPTETLFRNLGSVTDAGHNVRVPFTKNADMPRSTNPPATTSRALRTGPNVTVPHRPTETLSRNLGSVTDAGHNVRVPFTKNADMPRSTNPPATTSRAHRTEPNVTVPHRPTETLSRNHGSVTDAGHNVRVSFTKNADMPRSTNPPATKSRALRTGPNVTVPHRPTETLFRNLGSVTDAGHNMRVPFTKNADMLRSTNPPATTSRAHRTGPNVTVPHRPNETLSRNHGSVTNAGHNVRVPFAKIADMPRSTNAAISRNTAATSGTRITSTERSTRNPATHRKFASGADRTSTVRATRYPTTRRM